MWLKIGQAKRLEIRPEGWRPSGLISSSRQRTTWCSKVTSTHLAAADPVNNKLLVLPLCQIILLPHGYVP